MDPYNDQRPVAMIAQLVEQCTGIGRGRDRGSIFLGLSLANA